jgi:hypothetical protein
MESRYANLVASETRAMHSDDEDQSDMLADVYLPASDSQ